MANKPYTAPELNKLPFTRQTTVHSNSSQKVTGTYEPGVTQETLLPYVQGSWGGRWVKFENGEYEYIAYTD